MPITAQDLVKEAKQFVFDDRETNIRSELILMIRGVRKGGGWKGDVL